MRFPAQLPHHGLDPQCKLISRSRRWRLIQIYMGKWIDEIGTTIRTLQKVMVNVSTAITTFGFIIFGWRGEAGGYVEFPLSPSIQKKAKGVIAGERSLQLKQFPASAETAWFLAGTLVARTILPRNVDDVSGRSGFQPDYLVRRAASPPYFWQVKGYYSLEL